MYSPVLGRRKLNSSSSYNVSPLLGSHVEDWKVVSCTSGIVPNTAVLDHHSQVHFSSPLNKSSERSGSWLCR